MSKPLVVTDELVEAVAKAEWEYCYYSKPWEYAETGDESTDGRAHCERDSARDDARRILRFVNAHLGASAEKGDTGRAALIRGTAAMMSDGEWKKSIGCGMFPYTPLSRPWYVRLHLLDCLRLILALAVGAGLAYAASWTSHADQAGQLLWGIGFGAPCGLLALLYSDWDIF